jgi:hypothetical protein
MNVCVLILPSKIKKNPATLFLSTCYEDIHITDVKEEFNGVLISSPIGIHFSVLTLMITFSRKILGPHGGE